MQGLNKEKGFEEEKLMGRELDIVCITEGQSKIDKIQTSKGIQKIEVIGEQKDKKEGGLWYWNKEGKIKLKNSK